MMDAVRLRKWWWLKVAVHKRVSSRVIRIVQRRDWRWVVGCLRMRMGEHALRAITASRKITTRYHSRNLGRREIPWTI